MLGTGMRNPTIRLPAVAGHFYPSDPRELAQQIDRYCVSAGDKARALGCVVPHAGYMYSGHVAGAVYSVSQIPARCILVGPRHFPRGEPMAIMTSGRWRTPLGETQIDSQMAAELMRACSHLRDDDVAHAREHSLEVQIPFLQRLAGDFQFVPIVLATDRYEELEGLGHAIGEVVKTQDGPVLIIASSDMNHYESDRITRVKDRRAIDRILALDPRGLYETVRSEGITMCGYAAAVTMLVSVLDLGAKDAKLVKYATSGDINGDREEVVGYAGLILN